MSRDETRLDGVLVWFGEQQAAVFVGHKAGLSCWRRRWNHPGGACRGYEEDIVHGGVGATRRGAVPPNCVWFLTQQVEFDIGEYSCRSLADLLALFFGLAD